MITIDQLLESVDLDFEPRWVTKDIDGSVLIWDCKTKPVVVIENRQWECPLDEGWEFFGPIKLTEFADKPWQECIYEVPRKTTRKIEKLLEQKLTIGKTKYEYPTHAMMMDKINELVDAVNELKGAKNE